MNDTINNINCGISEKRFVNVRNKHCQLPCTRSYRHDAVEQLTSLLKHGIGSYRKYVSNDNSVNAAAYEDRTIDE